MNNPPNRRARISLERLKFTAAELEAKKQKAIAEEAERKARKIEENHKKNESRYIELGRALCEISRSDLCVDEEEEDVEYDVNCTGEEVVSSVSNFVVNLKKLLGDHSKGTIMANCLGLTSTLCGVNQKSVLYIDQRIERLKKARMEAARKELEAKERLEERWIEIGRAVCSLSPEDVGIDVPEDSPEDVSTSDLQKTSDSPEPLAWRGEDIIANMYHFSTALKDLMGVNAKHTCFRSQCEFTSIVANVAEKSVRDRHPVRKIGKTNKEFMKSLS